MTGPRWQDQLLVTIGAETEEGCRRLRAEVELVLGDRKTWNEVVRLVKERGKSGKTRPGAKRAGTRTRTRQRPGRRRRRRERAGGTA